MEHLVETNQQAGVDTRILRELIIQHGRLPGGGAGLTDDADLYAAGLTSLATVGVMLAIEEHFDIEFPDSKLNRATFRSVSSLAALISELLG